MKRFRQQEMEFGFGRKLVLVLSFFGVGIYGGFVQAGVGFLVITALLAHGLDLVRINAIKVFVIFAYTLIALGVSSTTIRLITPWVLLWRPAIQSAACSDRNWRWPRGTTGSSGS
jgi:uncharacterized membrane protein YfcA